MSRQRVAEGVYRYTTRQGTNYVVSASHKGAREWRATEPGATLREAKALRDDLRRELASPRPTGPAPWTVRIAADSWIKDGKVARLAASTLDVRRLAVEALCRHVDGSRPLRDLTVSDYEQARDALMEGKICNKTMGRLGGAGAARSGAKTLRVAGHGTEGGSTHVPLAP